MQDDDGQRGRYDYHAFAQLPPQERQNLLEAGSADYRFRYRIPHDGKSLADDSTPYGNYLQLQNQALSPGNILEFIKHEDMKK